VIGRPTVKSAGFISASAAQWPRRVSRAGKESRMSYVDGFIIAVKKDRLDDYKALARTASEVWMELGATAYVECEGDDTPYGTLTSFPRAVLREEDEVVIFSWIVYPSKAVRDAVNAKVMEDPRLKHDPANLPFDGKRMIYGGFRPFIQT
jgi:uncharacterized protein YbaA (DUF1428 family)